MFESCLQYKTSLDGSVGPDFVFGQGLEANLEAVMDANVRYAPDDKPKTVKAMTMIDYNHHGDPQRLPLLRAEADQKFY